MSTITIVRKGDYVAIAADTLTKYGYTNKKAHLIKNSSKIFQIQNNYIATVGPASGNLILTDYFSKLDSIPQLKDVQDIFKFACNLHRALKEDYFLNPNMEDEDDDLESSRFEFLIANEYGIFGIDSLRDVEEYTKFISAGAGYEFALGALEVLYDLNITAEEISRKSIEVAAEYDDCTGLPIESYTIKLKNH